MTNHLTPEKLAEIKESIRRLRASGNFVDPAFDLLLDHIAALEAERNLLHDALSLAMPAHWIGDKAYAKVEEYRVLAAARERVDTECERLKKGWNCAARECVARTEKIHELETLVEQQKARIAEMEYVGNLLAVIHGDGGHYIERHGWKKATEDAEAKWHKVNALLESLNAKLEKAEKERYEFMHDALTAISGAVCTPEKGYLQDGGLNQLLTDIKRLRTQYDDLGATVRTIADELSKESFECAERAYEKHREPAVAATWSGRAGGLTWAVNRLNIETQNGYIESIKSFRDEEIRKLRKAIKDAGHEVMQTSGDWHICDVSEYGKALEAKSLEVANHSVEVEVENRKLKEQLRDREAECERQNAYIDRLTYAVDTVVEIYNQQSPEDRPVKPVIMNRELMRKLEALAVEDVAMNAENRFTKGPGT